MTPQIVVSKDKWRDAVKYLVGLGTGPSLSHGDQRFLTALRNGRHIMPEAADHMLVKAGWSKTSDTAGVKYE
jgi:hypothetical protein